MQTDAVPSSTATILLVDDTRENLIVIGQILRAEFQVRVANSGERALHAVRLHPLPDLILLDVMMPDMDGYAVLRALRAAPQSRSIPVIFVTALSAEDDEELGLSLGAVDYVTKPIKPALLLARVRAQLELKHARDRLSDQNAFLDAEVQRRMEENELVKDLSLFALATLAEKRDHETGNHLRRTQAYVEVLLRELQNLPRFAAELGDAQTCQRIAKAAPLHDIGKVGIPDAILLKPGKLTADEFTIMQTHARIGADAIDEAITRAHLLRRAATDGSATGPEGALDFLQTARQIVLSHHERWDGTGYPDGLRGEAIPVAARLMALADVFDALVSRRPYKPAMALTRALDLIRAGRATHFDPDVVDAFTSNLDEFAAIAARYRDNQEDPP